MGVLWDDTAVYVNSASAKLIHSDNKVARNAVIDATLRNVSIASNLQGTILGGPGTTIKNYIRYSKSTYVHGIPSPEMYSEAMVTGSTAHVPIDMEFLAIAPIKVNGVYVNDEANNTSPEYLTSKSLLRKVGLQFNDLSDRIQENPNDAAVDDSFFIFSMDAYTVVEPSIIYLQKFFAEIASIAPVDRLAFEASLLPPGTGPSADPLRNVLRINEEELSTVITFDYCTTETVSGSLGPGIDAESVFEFNGYRDVPIDNAEGTSSIYRVFNTVVTYITDNKDGTLSKSSVFGLGHEEGITAGDEFTWTTQKHLLADYVGLDSTDLVGGTSGIHMPVATKFITELLPLPRQEAVMDSMMILIYSATVIELEWYQQGLVKAVIIVIAAWVAGVAAGKFLAAVSAAAASAGGITLGLIATTLVQIIGANFIVDFILKKVEGPLGIILAIAAMAALYRIPGGLFSISTVGMPTADVILEMANHTVYAGMADVENDLEDLKKDYKTYEDKAEAMIQELKDLQDPEVDRELALIVAQSTYENYNVPPESYFDLALLTGESIPMSYDIVREYVNTMLELPDPDYNPLYE